MPMRFLTLFFAFVILITHPAAAQNKKVTLDIFADQSAAQTGGEFTIGLRQNIAYGWHTYWSNPGDSGEALSVEWDVPNGVTISPMQFPVPNKVSYGADLTSYTLHGSPITTAQVIVADDFDGETLTLSGHAQWLVCEEICIPEDQTITMTLPVSRTSIPANQDVFKQAALAMPRALDWDATVSQSGETVVFTVSVPKYETAQMTDIEIIPYDYGIVNASALAIANMGENGAVSFEQPRGDADLSKLETVSFILKTDYDAFYITADNALFVTDAGTPSSSFFWILCFAFLGGIILNLMPCVFPVLSMKALSLVKLSDHERHHARMNGISYAAGVIVSFLVIASILIALKAGGIALGWGFQLQSPLVVSVLIAIVVAVGLNLWGVFEIRGQKWMQFGGAFCHGTHNRASFFTGVLATLVATPCTAPFMATAVGYALTQNAFIALCVFAFLGAGLAFPYVLFCFVPRAQKILPKPGAWMVKFRKILAVPMFVTAAWLLWVLAQQMGLIQHHVDQKDPFTRAALEQVLNDNPDRPVFTNMTAAWCITCLVNEKTSLTSDKVTQAFADRDVIYIKGDWTDRNAEITGYLESFGRNGVPLYVYYAPAENGMRPAPTVLPQILTPDTILETLNGEENK